MTSWETRAVIPMRGDGGLGCCGEYWLDSGFIVKVQPMGFFDRLVVGLRPKGGVNDPWLVA